MNKAIKYAATLSIAALALTGCSKAADAGVAASTETSVASTPSAATAFTLPDYKGQTLDVAAKDLAAHGIKLEAVDMVDAKAVVSKKNWTVDSYDPAAGSAVEKGSTVTFQVFKPKAEDSSAGADATSLGLGASYAQAACNDRAKSEFPFGYKPHWILGQLAEEIQNDKWFLKVEADVKNAYNAEQSLNVECTVGGTNDRPVVESFSAY